MLAREFLSLFVATNVNISNHTTVSYCLLFIYIYFFYTFPIKNVILIDYFFSWNIGKKGQFDPSLTDPGSHVKTSVVGWLNTVALPRQWNNFCLQSVWLAPCIDSRPCGSWSATLHWLVELTGISSLSVDWHCFFSALSGLHFGKSHSMVVLC